MKRVELVLKNKSNLQTKYEKVLEFLFVSLWIIVMLLFLCIIIFENLLSVHTFFVALIIALIISTIYASVCNTALRKELDTKNAELSEQKQKIKYETDKQNVIRHECDEKLKNTLEELDKRDHRINLLTNQVTFQKNRADNLENNISILKDQLKKKEAELKTLRNKNDTLRSQVNNQKSSIIKLEKSVKALNEENQTLKLKIASDASFINKLTNAINRFSKLHRYDSSERHVSNLGYLFSQIGWNNWKRSVHANKEQIDRYHRAKEQPIKLLSYDEIAEKAKIKGTSGKDYVVYETHCDCDDFTKTLKSKAPCKHIYFLARYLYNRQLTKGSET